MYNKKTNTKNIKQIADWTYSDLKWLTMGQAKLANNKRNKLLKTLPNKIHYSFEKNKIHLRRLSRGCLICGQGDWSCLFINNLCTTRCFFCPQDRNIKTEQNLPKAEGIIFKNPDDYVDYLKKFGFRGVGISGGEPLLVFEKLLLYIKKIRERLGKEFYIWIYTNGDLINSDKLQKLKKSGINEIRFNISAKNYDLSSTALATKFIKKVSVEIPVIPEDYHKVKKCMSKMRSLRINYLNLHQLYATKFNYKNYIKRNYTLIHHQSFPILESELTALKLLKHALNNNLGLAINYCSCSYKDRLQGSGIRKHFASLACEDFEEITNIGFIRRLSISGSVLEIKKAINNLKNNKQKNKFWLLANTNAELFIHSSLLKYINLCKYNFSIQYFAPQAKQNSSSVECHRKIILNPERKISVTKIAVSVLRGLSPVGREAFQELFIKNKDAHTVFKRFYENYKLKSQEDVDNMAKEAKYLMGLKTWEYLQAGFTEFF